MFVCIGDCVEFLFQKVEETQISDMLKSKDIIENVQAFQVMKFSCICRQQYFTERKNLSWN